MVITRTVEMHAQLVGYDFKKKGLPTDNNIAVENSKVSNDYFWKTNKYTDQDVFGRILDLTALINKPSYAAARPGSSGTRLSRIRRTWRPTQPQ